jgi:hypothetical protein
MPQPLSSFKGLKGSVHIGNNTDNPSDHRPELALLAMKVVSAWSILESFLRGLFVQMLGSNARPAVAMFNALESASAQRAVLRALARVVLSDRDNELFEAILSLFVTAGKDRNKVAHWVWGRADGLPDAVLLCDPDKLMDYRLELDEASARDLQERLVGRRSVRRRPFTPPPLPDRHIFVWRRTDFEGAIKRIERVTEFVALFRFVVSASHPANADDQLYRQLSSAPEIRTVLSHKSKGQKTPPKARPQRRRTPRPRGKAKSSPGRA